jgi:Zn-dependent protease with chaperone function
MEFKNFKMPEDINVTKEHPLKNFFYLLLGVASIMVATLLILFYSIGYVAKWIPFEKEVEWLQTIETSLDGDKAGDFLRELVFPGAAETVSTQSQKNKLRAEEITAYLQSLSDQLSLAQDLPASMKITVHYIDQPIINAFATVGGNVFIYQGLIDAVSSENGLSMVLAHEIAHVNNRHPIVALSRSLGLGVMLSLVTGIGGGNLSTNLASHFNLLTTLAFSRKQENQSDVDAYNTLLKYYGHGLGATELFSVLVESDQASRLPELLNSHPLSENRIERLNTLGAAIAANCAKAPFSCVLTKLPEFVRAPIRQ